MGKTSIIGFNWSAFVISIPEPEPFTLGVFGAIYGWPVNLASSRRNEASRCKKAVETCHPKMLQKWGLTLNEAMLTSGRKMQKICTEDTEGMLASKRLAVCHRAKADGRPSKKKKLQILEGWNAPGNPPIPMHHFPSPIFCSFCIKSCNLETGGLGKHELVFIFKFHEPISDQGESLDNRRRKNLRPAHIMQCPRCNWFKEVHCSTCSTNTPINPQYLPTRYIGTTSTSHHRSELLPLSLTFILGLVLLQASWDRPKKKWTHPALNESTSLRKNIPQRSHGSQSHGVLQTLFRGFSVTFPFFLQFGHLIFNKKQPKRNTSQSFNAKAPKPKSRRRSNKTWLWINPWNFSWVDGNTIYIYIHHVFASRPEIAHNKKVCVYLKKKGTVSQRPHRCKKKMRKKRASVCFWDLCAVRQRKSNSSRALPRRARSSKCLLNQSFFWVGPNSGNIWKTKTCEVKGALRHTSIFLLAGWFLHYLSLHKKHTAYLDA